MVKKAERWVGLTTSDLCGQNTEKGKSTITLAPVLVCAG